MKKIFILFVLFFYPVVLRAADGETDVKVLQLSIKYGLGILIIVFFACAGWDISRRINKKSNKLNNNYERPRQSREPAWKSRLQNTVPTQKQTEFGTSQKKEQEESFKK